MDDYQSGEDKTSPKNLPDAQKSTQLTMVQSQIDHLKQLRKSASTSRSRHGHGSSEPLIAGQAKEQQPSRHDSTNLTKLDKSPEQTPDQRRQQKALLGQQQLGSSFSEDNSAGISLKSSTTSLYGSSTQSVGATDAHQQHQQFNPTVVKLCFFVIFYLNLVVNIDHGVMPAGAITIKTYLGVSNTEYGLLGSIVFFGLVLGSLAATFVFNVVNTKVIIASIMLLNALSQLMFTTTTEYYYLLTSRFLTGFFQVFVSIYWPVWTDAFAGSERRKATWMSAFLVSSPIGVLVGYVLTTQLIIYYTWKYAFYVQAVAVIPAILLVIAMPNRYFSLKKNATSAMEQDIAINDDNERQLDADSNNSDRPQQSVREQMRSNPNRRSISQSYDSDQLDALFQDDDADMDQQNATSVERLGMNATTPNMDQLQNLENESTLKRVRELLKNGQFVLLTLSISSLYFVVTGLQYWVSAYLMITLQIDQEEVYYYYAFTCLSAPISGVIIGGILFNCIGGYNSPKAYALACLLGFFACVSCLPIPFASNKLLVYVLLWCVFFFGATIIAPLVGQMLASVQAERRTAANSIATLSYNLFGYLPAPFIYGLFSDIYPDNERASHRVAISVILYWSILAMAMMLGAMILFLKKQTQLHNKSMRELFLKRKDEGSRSEAIQETIQSMMHPQGDTGAADDFEDDDLQDYTFGNRRHLGTYGRQSMAMTCNGRRSSDFMKQEMIGRAAAHSFVDNKNQSPRNNHYQAATTTINEATQSPKELLLMDFDIQDYQQEDEEKKDGF